MITDKLSLEKHLDENPKDFTTRLVYADLLEEEGDSDFAKVQRWLIKEKKSPKHESEVLEPLWSWHWFNYDKNHRLPNPTFTWSRFSKYSKVVDYFHLAIFPTRTSAELSLIKPKNQSLQGYKKIICDYATNRTLLKYLNYVKNKNIDYIFDADENNEFAIFVNKKFTPEKWKI